MAEWVGSALFLAVFAWLLWMVFTVPRRRVLRRERDLSEVAEKLGFEFRVWGSNIHSKYCRLYPFGLGNFRAAGNLLRRQRDGWMWEVFDYHFGQSTSHCYGIIAVTGPVRFAKLWMRPLAVTDKLWTAVAGSEIAFESNEFNAKYRVRSTDRQFAHELLDPVMIDFLLGRPAYFWQVDGHVVIVHKPGRFTVEELPEVVEMLEGFVQRVPGYMFEDRGREAQDAGLV